MRWGGRNGALLNVARHPYDEAHSLQIEDRSVRSSQEDHDIPRALPSTFSVQRGKERGCW